MVYTRSLRASCIIGEWGQRCRTEPRGIQLGSQTIRQRVDDCFCTRKIDCLVNGCMGPHFLDVTNSDIFFDSRVKF